MKFIMSLKKAFLLCFIFSMVLTGFSQVKQMEVQEPFAFSIYSLKNGLTVILSKDETLPLVSVVCAYKVGSAYEEKGKTGLAHLLENLMFMGSRNVGPMQHIRFIHRIGGEFNAVTLRDKTFFYQTVPSNQLPLVLWLESDRMNSLNLNYTNVEETKNILIEVLRRKQKEDPFLESQLEFDRLLYPDFSYSHPVTGTEEDLKNITLKDAKNFYDTFYRPNNALLCITGDIDLKKTLELVKKYFQSLEPSKIIPSVPSFGGDFSQEKRNKILVNKDVSTPGFRLGYRIDSPYSNDFYILTMIDYLLFYGQSSRLHKRLVKRNKLALELRGGAEKRMDLASFKFFILSNNEATKEITKKALLSEINKLKTSLISDRELNKAKNMFKADYIDNYHSSEKRALFLVRKYLSKKNIKNLAQELDHYLNVSAPEIVGIMNRYFTEDNVLIEIRSK